MDFSRIFLAGGGESGAITREGEAATSLGTEDPESTESSISKVSRLLLDPATVVCSVSSASFWEDAEWVRSVSSEDAKLAG